MPISTQQVAHVARLARLALTPEEVDDYSRELTRIVAYFDRLAAIDIGGIETCSGGLSTGTVLRDDMIRPSLPVDAVLKNAPERKDLFFVVPRVI